MTEFVGKGLAAIAGGGFFCDDPPTFRSLGDLDNGFF